MDACTWFTYWDLVGLMDACMWFYILGLGGFDGRLHVVFLQRQGVLQVGDQVFTLVVDPPARLLVHILHGGKKKHHCLQTEITIINGKIISQQECSRESDTLKLARAGLNLKFSILDPPLLACATSKERQRKTLRTPCP